MRSGEQVGHFGADLGAALAELRVQLPDDLVLARSSDQPRQVKENIDLFMEALWEAVVLVVIVALVGFREWRSAGWGMNHEPSATGPYAAITAGGMRNPR